MPTKSRVLARRRGARSLEPMTLAAARALRDGDGLDAPLLSSAYGVALASRAQRTALGAALQAPPYGAPPEAPVLYVKTPNTFAVSGGRVAAGGERGVRINANLAVVIGRAARRVDARASLDHVLGYGLAIDVCAPYSSHHRPVVRQQCRDGFLPISAWITPAGDLAAPDGVRILTEINGAVVEVFDTADLVRPLARLIADVSAFMTLEAGDVLLTGASGLGPTARAGERVRVGADGLAEVRVEVVADDEEAGS